MRYFLGIDIGTSGTKSLLIDENGLPVAANTQTYPLSTPRPLWAEQSPEDWWEGAVTSVRVVLAESGIKGEQIAGIGLSGQMHGSVFLDAKGDVLRPAILWCDQRTQAECDWITAQAGAGNLAEYIGNPVLTGFTAPKIVWLRNNEPETYAKVAQVLLPKDYIRYRLTGVYATEVSDASGTALLDVKNRRWSQPMLAAVQIPPGWMPECYESQEVSGKISPEIASLTGLSAGTPVVGGGGDQAAGAVGTGIVRTGIVSSVLGTSGVVFAYADSPAVDSKMRVHTFCHAVPGKWHTMGVILSAAGSLRWLRDTFFQPEVVVAKSSGDDAYNLITKAASTVPAGAEGLIFLPYLSGERTPYPDPYARGVFFGATLRHDRRHFARAVLEGVAYAMNDTFEIFREIGVPIDEVRASGGGAKSPVWRQIQADVTGKAHRTLGIDEGPALGAALLAAVGTGSFPSVADACAAAIKTVDSSAPNPAHQATYRKYYDVYRSLYPALKSAFHDVSVISV